MLIPNPAKPILSAIPSPLIFCGTCVQHPYFVTDRRSPRVSENSKFVPPKRPVCLWSGTETYGQRDGGGRGERTLGVPGGAERCNREVARFAG